MGIHKESKTSEFNFSSPEHTHISVTILDFCLLDNEKFLVRLHLYFSLHGVVVFVVDVGGGGDGVGGVLFLLHVILLGHRLLIPCKEEGVCGMKNRKAFFTLPSGLPCESGFATAG
jgi:hypothetical protein